MAKGKKKVQAVIKQYKFITKEEVHARELKYQSRLTDLAQCLQYLDDATAKAEFINEEERKAEKWRLYLACESLPKPYIPPETRLFFIKLRERELEGVEKTIDWLLSVDERSILTQNVKKDFTQRVLVEEMRPNFGFEYEAYIDLGLRILKSINDYLDDENMTIDCPPRVLLDIFDRKSGVQDEIHGLFNRYTYRVLSSEDSYMESVDAISSEYYYEAKNFKLHLWTLKNVPILFNILEDPFLVADLHSINSLKVQIPLSLLEDNLTLRCLHLHFDHCSEHAKSFEQTMTGPLEHINAGIDDLHNCLINEWSMQMELQNEVRNKMIQKRLDYDEKVKLIEDLAKGKVDKNDTKKKKKPPTLPKEPPLINNDTFPDIWEDFLEKEQKEYEEFINKVYHPSVLNLDEGEVNMKEYLILGGVYEMYFVKKPVHYTFAKDKFNMTWHTDHGNLHVRKNLRVPSELERMERMAAARFSLSFRRASMAASHIRSTAAIDRGSIRKSTFRGSTRSMFDENPLVRQFVITIDIPPYLCLWGEPMACQYEDHVVGYLDPSLTSLVKPAKSTDIYDEPEVEDDENEEPKLDSDQSMKSMSIASLAGIEEYTPQLNRRSMTRLSTFNMFRGSLSLASLKSRVSTESVMYADHCEIDDFNLDFQITKVQIRNLQRHCLPRIISSYKFPNEIYEEENDAIKSRPKGKGGILVRKRYSHDDPMGDRKNKRLFLTVNQNNPERLFPHFTKEEPLNLQTRLESYMDMLVDREPETFSELLNVINKVKKYYLTLYYKTLYLQAFRQKAKVKSIQLYQEYIPPVMDDARGTVSSTATISKRRTTKTPSATKELRPSSASKSSLHKSIGSQKSRGLQFADPADEESESTDESEEWVNYADTSSESSGPGDKREKFIYAHWTTEHIVHSEYDKLNCRLTVYTDRLGIFGFAFKRYEHFPFRSWSLVPSTENPEEEVVFTLETKYVTCVLYVTAAGYRGYVTESGQSKKYQRKRLDYLVIDEPTTDFKELKKLFREKNINIFPENDARFYIENGYFSEKHLAAELHTYSSMAVHCGQVNFMWSEWNRLAHRRDIILTFSIMQEEEFELCLAHITPEDATFVDITEVCSIDVNEIKLEYTPTWRNMENYTDLNQMIISVDPTTAEVQLKKPGLICCVKNLLCAIRPLSYS